MPRNGSRRRNQRNVPAEANRSVDLAPLKGYVGYAVRRAQMTIFGDFVESLRETYPYYVTRFVGGLMFLAGMLVMAWNAWKTCASGKGIPEVRVPLPAHA